MPLPKDPDEARRYCERMSRIAKRLGFGRCLARSNKGRKLGDSHKAKISQAAKKIGNASEERAARSKRAKALGCGKWMKGRKLSEATRLKMSLARRGRTYEDRYGAERAIEVREKMSATHRVLASSRPDVLQNLTDGRRRGSDSLRGRTYAEIYGHDLAKIEAKKRSEASRGKPRKHAVLGGGDRRLKHNSDVRYVEWRTAVFTRDDFTCQNCGVRGGRIQAHHIKSWARYPSLRFEVLNGVTLCRPCHKVVNARQAKLERKLFSEIA